MGRRLIPHTSEDDEHKLISRYVHRLKQSTASQQVMHDPISERQNLVFELEAKNREIQKEIQRLKCQQRQQQQREISSSSAQFSELDSADENNVVDGNLLKEIRLLRQHQEELEERMKGLQGSRRGLIQQLEGLMRKFKLLKLAKKSLDMQFAVDLNNFEI
ncbi:hypothetical protein HELRODRAFT_158752 [Helobdella robusta]|uniref:Uncharacterized protein n=1 Tax=Helobdella robusta TaxID=6412 RepID=T1EN74_HELRO|nr:hypothetical protein HELRODRAFT_158752 [Helobdella robusta]ESO12271.1 hypothetical protein HELRODRAFT_158752 [Helobdella robusta]